VSYDLGTAHGKIVLDYDSDKAVGRAEDDIDKLERKAKTSNGTLTKLGKTLSGFAGGAKIAGMAVAMGTAAIQAAALLINVLGIVPALTSILSLTAAIPGALAGGIAAVLVLKAAFAGVGDAIKAALDPTKAAEYQKALEKLAPSARAFVEAIHSAAPQLKAFQQQIQESFFSASKLAGQVPRMVKALSQLRPMVNGLASDFGELVRRLANFALSQDSIQFVSDAMQVFRAAVADAGTPLIKLLIGLRDVGNVGLPLLLQMSDAVNTVAGKFGEWLSAISNDGRLQAWIDLALKTLSTLGDIAKNVGSILFSVISAAQQAGGGLLGTLANITGQIAALLKSTDGFNTLVALFSGILKAASALAPAVLTLVAALAKALAPAIDQIATVLGPVLLQIVDALAPAFGPLAQAIADLVKALAPLLPPVAQLIALLAGIVTVVAQGLIKALGPLISLIASGLSGAITALMPVVGSLSQLLPVLADAGIQLAAAFAPLIPVLVQLAQTIAQELVKVMPDLIKAVQPLIPVLVTFAGLLTGKLIQALTALIKILPPVIDAFVQMLPILIQVSLIGLRIVNWLLQLSNAIQGALAWLGKFIGALAQGLLGALQGAFNAIVTAGAAIIGWFQALPGRIMSFLAALPGMLENLFVSALQGIATVIGFQAGLIVGFFTKLPGDILHAVVTLGPILWGWMQNVWMGIQQRVVNGTLNAISFLHDFPRRAYNAVLNLVSLLRTVATNAWNGLINKFQSGASNAVASAGKLPGRIRSALGNLGNLLLSSGTNIINGLISGINRGIGRVLDLVRGLADRVRSAFNNALNIFSPSRDFKWSGEMIGLGLISGLKKKMLDVQRAAEALANTVIAPTVALPASASAAAMNVAFTGKATPGQDDNRPRNFGPYQITVDGKVIAAIVIDTITGAPTVVSKAANEGDRLNEFAGSGRR
jgi:phage-related protein